MRTKHSAARRPICIALLVCAVLALGSLPALAAASSPTVTQATGGAGVPGAVSTTLFDLSSVGYVTDEYFIAGNAVTYSNVSGQPFTANGIWTTQSDANPTAFKTRLLVYRPSNPATFNGVVIVEWLNVTNQFDSAADWLLTHNEMIREGAAYVGVTAQAVAVNGAGGLRNVDPARYGAAGANLVHPGDSWSYDIYSQAGQAVRDSSASILGGLTPQKVIAMGESQSATRMVTYIDGVHPLHHVYDGFYVHSRGATGAALRGNPPGTISSPANTLIRTDLDVPVFVLQSETDTRGTRLPDSSVFRQWEVPGSAHADMYTLGIGQFDDGTTNDAAVSLFNRMLNPTNDPLPGSIDPCGLPVNSGPHHWAVQASLHHLIAWVKDGTAPPAGAFLQTASTPTSALVLDANGNAQGGLRTPHVDVPVATIRGTGQPVSNLFCSLFGVTTPFTQTKLETLYASHAAFASAWNASVDAAVATGAVLSLDAPKLKFSAADSNVGLRVPGTPSVTGVEPADSALVVSFSPPGGVDDDKISGYTATCTDGAASTGSASGSSSPITVSGLTDGNAHTCTVRATNPIGDSLESAPSASTTVGVDPDITITTPPDGAEYLLNASVLAAYACTDEGGSGLASCVGPVANGSAIDTASVGSKSFTVDAADNAGNTASETDEYRVLYAFDGFKPPFNKDLCAEFKAGKSVDVKFKLLDANGVPVGSANPTVTLAEIVDGTAGPEFDAVPQKGTGNTAGYDAKAKEYRFEMSTAGLGEKTYRMTVQLDDGTQHAAQLSGDKHACKPVKPMPPPKPPKPPKGPKG